MCLLVHIYSDSALSGVMGFYPQFQSHTDRLHLQEDPKTCRKRKYIDITYIFYFHKLAKLLGAQRVANEKTHAKKRFDNICAANTQNATKYRNTLQILATQPNTETCCKCSQPNTETCCKNAQTTPEMFKGTAISEEPGWDVLIYIYSER